ncbi:MAG: NifB/NifX family molybdenum-iron cluster-binding protein [Thermoplasmata archaeon]|nr:NifB/NifX family molybdenum-iron cluster-binding protein [Thermoplasmata archaeon]
MKIVVATNTGGLEDSVSPVFGRCQTFTVVEAEGNEIKRTEVIPNQFAAAVHGAGIQAAQWVASQGAKAVIAGNFGPNVTNILQQAGVEMVVAQGIVREVVEKYLRGELSSSPSPPSSPPQPYYPQPQPTYPQPFPYPPYYPPPYYWPSPPLPLNRNEEIRLIEEELRRIEDTLNAIKRRLEELKGE